MSPALTRFAAIAGAATALSMLLAPATAHACWDGYAASVESFDIQHPSGVGEWSPSEARRVARWGKRIAALLPKDARLTLVHGTATCDGSGCGKVSELELDPANWTGSFSHVAAVFEVPAAAQSSALGADPTVYTVQVFAGSLAGARAAKSRAIDVDGAFFGFYQAGGFPASNDDAHILFDGAIHRVVMGTYLDRMDADAARLELEALGLRGFVRELPPGDTVEERSFSMVG